jgi:hypothetical protein
VRLTGSAIPFKIKELVNRYERSALSWPGPAAEAPYSCLLPPRSMVGQLTLDQHIGVRIPGGQPIKSINWQPDLLNRTVTVP